MDRGLCHHCHERPIVGRCRKFCPEHSRDASIRWKRKHRRLWKASGDKYWLADWKTPEARREYFRAYMRRYRLRRARQSDYDSAALSNPAPDAAPPISVRDCRSQSVHTSIN